MFERIMVPVDLSDKNLTALEIAAKMALRDQASVILLHVIERIEHIPFEELKDFYERLEKSAKEKMSALAEKLLEKSIPTTEEIIYGKRVEEIVKYAIDHRIDLIILSSHKIDIARPSQGWGSISYKVALLSQCPVLLVK
jgi:universal stress protein A